MTKGGLLYGRTIGDPGFPDFNQHFWSFCGFATSAVSFMARNKLKSQSSQRDPAEPKRQLAVDCIEDYNVGVLRRRFSVVWGAPYATTRHIQFR